MFKKILIANRAEIAVRIIRSCKEMGITTAAIYSEPDKKMLHTIMADEAYYIGSALSSDSYLNQNKIIELAKNINADAIHPGYGFLSENSSFIEAVENAGITFIGPSSQSVKMMGSKTAARELMKKYNVPIVPGTTKPIKDLAEGIQVAKEITYPILLKASAGGGGKGMRRVDKEEDFESSFESTKREALKSFSDDSVYIEKFIENPKHIEVQILADKHGNYFHIFERDCSLQRRHQKIIEEAPSVVLDDLTREKITEAAINAARACKYHNAGTIEFLLDKDKKFYFLEMNTRLQVEHPVSECITGLDLVKEQIKVAAGEKLNYSQKDISLRGHSIECRLYAEDADNNFLPSTGTITDYRVPEGPGVRIDAGVFLGSEISIHYDPMIAKVIVHAKTREDAIDRMKRALMEFCIAGVITNQSFLINLISSKEFLEGTFDINFIEDKFIKEYRYYVPEEDEIFASVAASLLKSHSKKDGKPNIQSSNIYKNNWIKQLYE